MSVSLKYRSLCNIQSFKLLFMALLLPLCVVSCQNDDFKSEYDLDGSKYIELKFQTRDLANNNGANVHRELKVEEVVTLVFDEENKFAYRAENTKPVYDSETKTYSINAVLKESEQGEKYSISLIANPTKKEYGNLRYLHGQGKEVALKNFTYDSSTTNSYSWLNKETSVPMYGETAPTEITKGTTFKKPITLLRSMAKVDIFFKKSDMVPVGAVKDGTAVNYSLHEVFVYNTLSESRIAPELFTNGVQTPWVDYTPKTPSLVEHFINEDSKYNQRIDYRYSSVKNTLSNTILLPENRGGFRENSTTTTTLIMGVTADGTEDAAVRYYRLSIVNSNDAKYSSDILRNVYYRMHILDIQGAGSSTPEEALVSKDFSTVDLSIEEWKVIDLEIELPSREFFKIEERSILIQTMGVSEIPFTTNLDEIGIAWTPNRNTANIAIKNTDYLVRIVKEDGKDEGVLQIEPLRPLLDPFYEAENTVYIFAGNLIIPIEIEQIKEAIYILDNYAYQVDAVPFGYYVDGKAVGKQNYIQFSIEADKVVKGKSSYPVSDSEVTVDASLQYGDTISVVGSADASGVRFELIDYVIGIDDFKVLNTKEGNRKVVSVNVPALGTVASGTKEISPKIEFSYKKKKNDFLKGMYPKEIKIPILLNKPVSNITPKILIVGDSYSFDPKTVYSFWNSRYYDVSVARLLFNENLFGLKDKSTLKVEPFLFTDGENVKRIKNIKHVHSFRELGNPSDLDNFNIILYLNSAEENEIQDANNIYGKYVVDMIKAKKVVFIQTPSRETQLDSSGDYTDPIISSVLGTPGFKVSQTSASTQNAFAIDINSNDLKKTISFYDGSAQTLASNKVYFPARDNKSLLRFANIFANFRDTSYVLKYDANKVDVVGTKFLVGKLQTYAVGFRSKEYPYMWIGNTSVFADSAIELNKNYFPVKQSSDEYSGWLDIPIFTTYTYNSAFFINTMEWALKSLDKLKL